MAKNIIAVSATQGCFGFGTPVRMYDGTIKEVQNIKVGDVVMGDDSTPRKVLLLRRGEEELFEFEYVDGVKHIYNKSHELILQYSQSSTTSKRRAGDEVITTVGDYLNFSKDKKRILCKFNKPIITDKNTKLQVPPYILGIWLGDGHSANTCVTNTDDTIIEQLAKFVENKGLMLSQKGRKGITYNVVTVRGQCNPFLDSLKYYNLINNKHIPIDYFKSWLFDRLELLAGLLDADGYLNKSKTRYEIIQKNKVLAYDIFYLVRSCGLHSTIKKVSKRCTNTGSVGEYYNISITRGITIIPCRVARKKASKVQKTQRNTTRVGVRHVTSLGIANYYGFTLDGNNRFLHADGTVLKNCGKTTIVYSIATFLKKLGKNVAIINELARECPFPINKDADDRTQSWIVTKQITKEFEKMDKYEYLIVDRSVLDPICYSKVLGDTAAASLLHAPYLVEHVKNYYKTVYLLDPVFFNWNIDDGVRDTDNKFRNSVHDAMLDLFESSGISYKLIRSSDEIYYDLIKF